MKSLALVCVGLLAAAGCGLVYSYDGYEAAGPGVGGSGATGTGGGGTAGTGTGAVGGTAGTGGTDVGGFGGDGCVVGSHCEAAVDPDVWGRTGDVLPNGSGCTKTSVSLSDKLDIDALTGSSTCTWTCSGGNGLCKSDLTCSKASDCATQPFGYTIHSNNECLPIGDGSMITCSAGAVVPEAGSCTPSGVTPDPALPVPSVGCYRATSPCPNAATSACVLDMADCIAADGAGDSCPAPYAYEKNFYQSVQDDRCVGVGCAALVCFPENGQTGPTLWQDTSCQVQPVTIPADGSCPGGGASLHRSVNLPFQQSCPAAPASQPASGQATGTLVRWCCKSP